MKKRLGMALCACILSAVALGSFANDANAELDALVAPVAHIPMDEGAGAAVSYGSGSGVVEGRATWTPGQQGSALELAGAGYVEIADPADGSLDLSQGMTLALWVRPDALGGHQMLISKDNAYELEFGKLNSRTLNLRLNNFIEGTASTLMTEGVWQHIAVTFNRTQVRFYRNGQPDGSHPHGRAIHINDNAVGIGARPSPPSSGGPAFQLHGGLDDVRIYDYALAAADIANLFAATARDLTPPTRSLRAPDAPLASVAPVDIGLSTNEAATCRYVAETTGVAYKDMASDFATLDGVTHRDNTLPSGSVSRYFVRCRDSVGNVNKTDYLVAVVVGDVDLEASLEAYWTLDDGAGCVATDGTGNHDADLGPACLSVNAPQWTPGVFGSGLTFNGDDEVRATNDGALQTPAAVTLSAWVRHATTPQFRSIIDVRDDGTDGYDLYLNDQSRLFMRVGGSTLTGPVTVADGTWHHAVGVYDGTSITLYVDGLPVASSTAIESIDVSADLVLGKHFAVSAYSFDGDMDEVVMYSRGLNAAEVFQLYLDTQP